MTQGKAKVDYLHSEGLVGPQHAPSWDFIYRASTVKDPNWNIGDRVVLPDGREFYYAKSAGACISGQGCEFTAVGVLSYTAAGVSQSVGDKQVTVPAATHDAFTKDELRGGYALIYDGSTNNVQFRGIIGNDATAANVAFVIYLDGALTEAVVAGTSAIEAFQNPYAALQTSISDTKPVAGVPAVKVTAANTYFWVQTRKFCWVAPQGTVIGNEGKGCYWRHDGSLDDPESTFGLTSGDIPAGCTSQYAGHLVEGDYAGIGPLFNLQD
jgi:hypothetical protein